MTTLNANFQVPYQFPVIFSDNIFQNDSAISEFFSSLSATSLILPVIEQQVALAHPDIEQQITSLCEKYNLSAVPAQLAMGGESCKNTDQTVHQIIDACIAHQIDRHSYILAIGGGAFVDMVGYAATITHRGIRLIRVPTTVLAQNDAGIGVKNAINYDNRKNFLGTFSPPFAVINSLHFIDTLTDKDKRAGIAEAIKVALIKDDTFFNYLTTHSTALAQFSKPEMAYMIARCAELHLDHICHNGDPFEQGSARPLDFGHWCAHAIEELSDFELRHGEAVAMGILIDSDYSYHQGWLAETEYATIKRLIKTLGFPICSKTLRQLPVDSAIENFRAHLGGQLCITMLKGLGQSHEVNQIDSKAMQQSVDRIIAEG